MAPDGAGGCDGQVLDEGVKGVGASPVTVQEVEHLVEEEENRRSRGLEDAGNRVRPGRGGAGGRAELRDPSVARELAGDVNPRGLAAGLRVPGVAHEDGHTGNRGVGEARFPKKVLVAVI